MSLAKLKGTSVLVKVGDGGTPTEAFTLEVLINTKRTFKFNSSQQKDLVPDPSNPDAPVWESTFIDGLNLAVDGAGKLDTAQVPTFDTWFQAGTVKNCRVCVGAVGYWTVPMKLASFSVDGDRNKYAECSLTLVSDGPPSAYTLGAG